MADRESATGDLGLVQDFVNTLDLEPGTEELHDAAALRDWLAPRGLMDAREPVGEPDLKNALAVREAMRSLIGGNSGLKIYPVALATLNQAATASGLRIRFGGDGRARLEPESHGIVGAMGRLVASLYAAMQTPEWERLKLCGSGTCRWAFYDRSKNQSSRWCTMATCGNRAKARRFREKERASSSPARG